MELIIAPFRLFMQTPFLAFVPALLFLLLWRAKRSRSALVATILWALYAVYEFGISRGVLCDAECDIRVDLLLIAPVLLIASIVAIVQALRRR